MDISADMVSPDPGPERGDTRPSARLARVDEPFSDRAPETAAQVGSAFRIDEPSIETGVAHAIARAREGRWRDATGRVEEQVDQIDDQPPVDRRPGLTGLRNPWPCPHVPHLDQICC